MGGWLSPKIRATQWKGVQKKIKKEQKGGWAEKTHSKGWWTQRFFLSEEEGKKNIIKELFLCMGGKGSGRPCKITQWGTNFILQVGLSHQYDMPQRTNIPIPELLFCIG